MSVQILREEAANGGWEEVQDEMNNALASMRVDREDALTLKVRKHYSLPLPIPALSYSLFKNVFYLVVNWLSF